MDLRIESKLGHKYYLVLLDDFSHFIWTYPLQTKSQVFNTYLHFQTYIQTQFHRNIKNLQCDNGKEFYNSMCHQLFTCPYTSPQNGKAERIIHTINNMIRTNLLHASLPPHFWHHDLSFTTYLLNILPSNAIRNKTPTEILYLRKPTYSHLRTFGCLCYPNIYFTTPHKLVLRSIPSIFLGYPPNHRGYLCHIISTNQPIISLHVTFDEQQFPHQNCHTYPPTSYEFLDDIPPLLTFLIIPKPPPLTHLILHFLRIPITILPPIAPPKIHHRSLPLLPLVTILILFLLHLPLLLNHLINLTYTQDL